MLHGGPTKWECAVYEPQAAKLRRGCSERLQFPVWKCPDDGGASLVRVYAWHHALTYSDVYIALLGDSSPLLN